MRVNPIAKKFSPIRLQSELEDVLDSVPPEHRKVIEKMMISSSVQMRSMVSPETTVMKKLTSEHISRYLDGAELEIKSIYFFNNDCRNGFFIIIVVLLKDTPDIMEKFIYTVGGVVIGAFGGYRFGKNKND